MSDVQVSPNLKILNFEKGLNMRVYLLGDGHTFMVEGRPTPERLRKFVCSKCEKYFHVAEGESVEKEFLKKHINPICPNKNKKLKNEE